MAKIKDLPKILRPREKLLSYGLEKLSNSELLAILLRTGQKGRNVVDLAMKKKNDIPELLTLQETCELLKKHSNTLRKWDVHGILKAVRIGPRGDRRYKTKEVLNYLKTINKK